MIDVGVPIGQGAPPHGHETLGGGPRTFRQSGCFFSCFVMAARALTGHRGLTILEAHARVMRADGFAGSGLRRGRAAKALGMRLLDADGSESFHIDNVRADLAIGRPVIAGLDYRPGRSSGFSDADHFVIIVGDVSEPDRPRLRCADPASGMFIEIDPTGFRYARQPARIVELCRLLAEPT